MYTDNETFEACIHKPEKNNTVTLLIVIQADECTRNYKDN